MITKIAFIGLAGFLSIQSFFELSEQVFTFKKREGWDTLVKAQQFVADGSYDTAANYLDQVIEKHTDDPQLIEQAKYELTIAHYRNKNFEEMFPVAKDLVKSYPDETTGKTAFFFIGEYYNTHLKNYDYAITSYQLFLNKIANSPFTPVAYFNIAKMYYEQNKYDDAIYTLVKMEQEYRRSSLIPEVKQFLLTLYLKTNQPKKALSKIEELQNSPNLVKLNIGWFSIGDYFYEQKEHLKAMEYYGKVKEKKVLLKEIQTKIDSLRGITETGKKVGLTMSYYDRGEQQGWWKEFNYDLLLQETQESEDLYPFVLYKTGCCYYELNDLNNAEKTFTTFGNKYSEFKPELYAQVNYYLSMVYQKQNKPDKLRKLEETKLTEETKLALLQKLYNENNFKSVIESYEKGTYKFTKPKTKELGTLLVADSYFMNNQFRPASELYGKFIDQFPQSSYIFKAKFNQAVSFKELKSYEKSVGVLAKLLVSYPNHPDYTPMVLLRLGDTYNLLKNHDRALVHYKMFLDKFPAHKSVPFALFATGNLSYQTGAYDNCIVQCKKLIESFPQDENAKYALYYIGLAYKMKKVFPEMVETFKKIISLYPDSDVAPESLYWIAWNYNREKNLSKAAEVYAELIRRYPDKEITLTARFDKVDALLESNQSEQALQEFNDMLLAYDSPTKIGTLYTVLDKIIDLYQKNKQTGQINPYFTKLSEQFKGKFLEIPVRLKLAEYLYRQKKYAEAVTVISKDETRLTEYKLAAGELYLIAEIYFNVKNYEPAFNYYLKVVSTYPYHELIRNSIWGMAECYLNLGDKSVNVTEKFKPIAERNYGKIADIDPVNYALGKCYFQNKEYAKVVSVMKNVVGKFSELRGAESTYILAYAHQQIGEYDAAIKYYARMVLVYSQYNTWMPQSYYNAARCYEAIKETKKAADLYKELADKYGNTEYGKKAKSLVQ